MVLPKVSLGLSVCRRSHEDSCINKPGDTRWVRLYQDLPQKPRHTGIENFPGDFPGGPVVKALRSQRRWPRFDPWSGN